MKWLATYLSKSRQTRHTLVVSTVKSDETTKETHMKNNSTKPTEYK